MQYYHHEQFTQMKTKASNKKLDVVLQKHFPQNNKWGANVLFDEDGYIDTIEICKLSDVTLKGATWTHYATISLYDDGTWEVFSQFNGTMEDELWVFAYYKRFADACKCIANGKFKTMKPIKTY